MNTINKDDTLILVPAKGNSTRLPGKNLLNLRGMPLVYWTILFAVKNFSAKNVRLSTDSKEILEIGSQLGLTDLEPRDPILCKDITTTREVIDWEMRRNPTFKKVVILAPTSPLRISSDLIAFTNLIDTEYDSASLCENHQSFLNSYVLKDDRGNKKYLEKFSVNAHKGTNSQSWPKTYKRNGSMFGIWAPAFQADQGLLREKVKGFVMPSLLSLDINDAEDFFIMSLICDKLELTESNWEDNLKNAVKSLSSFKSEILEIT